MHKHCGTTGFAVQWRAMIPEYAVPTGTAGAWTEAWTRLADGSLAHLFEFIVSRRVWVAREDRVGGNALTVPGSTRVYIENCQDGIDGSSARSLAAELLATAELLAFPTVLGL